MASLEKDHSYSETPEQPEATPEEYAVAGNANYFGKGISFRGCIFLRITWSLILAPDKPLFLFCFW